MRINGYEKYMTYTGLVNPRFHATGPQSKY